MSSPHAARVVRHHVPHIRPAVASANACVNCFSPGRTSHSLRRDQRLLLSVVQQTQSHRLCDPLNRRFFHGSPGPQVLQNWIAVELLADLE
jgi:hypothetical protein